MKWLALAMLALFMALMIYAETGLTERGDAGAPASVYVSPEYIARTEKDTKTPNIVTSVLADYRGYDTLGETTVIFTAGLSAVLILMRGTADD